PNLVQAQPDPPVLLRLTAPVISIEAKQILTWSEGRRVEAEAQLSIGVARHASDLQQSSFVDFVDRDSKLREFAFGHIDVQLEQLRRHHPSELKGGFARLRTDRSHAIRLNARGWLHSHSLRLELLGPQLFLERARAHCVRPKAAKRRD